MDGGAPTQPEGQHGEVETLDHRLRRWVVGVDHGRAPGLRRPGEEFEESALGATVLGQGAMEVEVVLRQVREDRDVEREAVHARERQGVRGHLHGDAADPALAHERQHGAELERAGGRLTRRPALGPEHVLDGADDAGREPSRAQQRLDEIRGGRLAVRPGDPDEQQLARGMTVERVRQPRERLARRGHEHLSDGHAGERFALRDDQRRSPTDCLGDEATRILSEPRHRDEAAARLDPSRVVGDGRDRRRRRADDGLDRQRREELAHRHGPRRHLI